MDTTNFKYPSYEEAGLDIATLLIKVAASGFIVHLTINDPPGPVKYQVKVITPDITIYANGETLTKMCHYLYLLLPGV